jgi:hypothetical protein
MEPGLSSKFQINEHYVEIQNCYRALDFWSILGHFPPDDIYLTLGSDSFFPSNKEQFSCSY